MIGTVIGPYRIERSLGEGGMAHVWIGSVIRATTTLPEGYTVVLKIISDELANETTAQKRFVKEAQILSKLRHRYITRFYEFVPREEGSVLVMEFVDGTPLDQLISKRGALGIPDSISITQCLLEALVYAHGKGIVHRDIKPANLIVQRTGVKVTDFGIAKIKESGGSTGTVLTKSGFLLGTPHYMSPEQIREPKDAGAKSDVYSSGVVLYEMLTGALPFNSRSLPKLIDAVYRGDKPAPSSLRPDVDADLESIVLKSMHPNVNDRYESAREFFEALEEYTARPRIFAAPMPTPPPATINAPAVPTPAPGKVYWHLVPVDGTGMTEHSIDDASVIVGRDRTCPIVLNHPAVSRRHARITIDKGNLQLEDLKSANGTYVNNSRVETVRLHAGDIVRFGADPTCSFIVRDR